MIEEFMLMANMSIARRISDTFPEGAMLRRHPPPKQVSIEELVCAFKQTANHACMHAYTYVMYVRMYVCTGKEVCCVGA